MAPPLAKCNKHARRWASAGDRPRRCSGVSSARSKSTTTTAAAMGQLAGSVSSAAPAPRLASALATLQQYQRQLPQQQQQQLIQMQQLQHQLRSVLPAVGCTVEQLALAAQEQLRQQGQVLITGVDPELYAGLRKLLPGVLYHARARMLLLKASSAAPHGSGPAAAAPAAPPKQQRLPGSVAVVYGGAADLAIAEQVKLAAEHMGCYVMLKGGLSTADLPRLLQQLPGVGVADVLVAVAGTDVALPAILCGLVAQPIIALPACTDAAAASAGGAGGPIEGLGAMMAGDASSMFGVTTVGLNASTSAAAAAARVLVATAKRTQLLQAAAAAQGAPGAAAASAHDALEARSVPGEAVRMLEQQMLKSSVVVAALPLGLQVLGDGLAAATGHASS